MVKLENTAILNVASRETFPVRFRVWVLKVVKAVKVLRHPFYIRGMTYKNIMISAIATLLALSITYGYDRVSYGIGWPKLTNHCTVRTYTLAKHSLNHVSCTNLNKGLWVDLYTGDTIHDERDMDADHVVPLEEVDLSGGSRWPDSLKHAYYADTTGDHLLPVSAHQNRSKGAKSVTKYLPPLVSYRQHYCLVWYTEKKRYHLTATLDEVTVLRHYLGKLYRNDLVLRK